MNKLPRVGDKYFTGFESDFDPDAKEGEQHFNGNQITTIDEIAPHARYEEHGQTGFNIIPACEPVWHQCFWSPLLKMWCYSCDISKGRRAAMQWTKEVPEQAGYYWFREREYMPYEIVKFELLGLTEFVPMQQCIKGNTTLQTQYNPSGEWYGPLEVPKHE